MNILITGVSGFVGCELAKTLVQTGHQVYGLVRHTSDRNQRRMSELNDVHLIHGDITSYHSVRSAIRECQPETICHLAALTPVRNSFTDPMPYMPTNFEGTVNMVQGFKEESPRGKLIVASTAEVYGWQEPHAIRESNIFKPASPYAVSKAAADLYVQMANHLDELGIIILRPINTYGRKASANYMVEYVVKEMLANKPIYVGTPESVRDYMFIKDHVQAYLKAMKNGFDGAAYNVSPGNAVSNRQLVNTLATMTGYKGKVHWGSYPPGYPVRPKGLDPSYLVLDGQKIRHQLKWVPEYGLKEGLKKTVEMWLKHN